jgi:hypothetical protein
MMSGLLRYLELQAKSKTGLSSGVAIWAIVALVAAVITLGFAIFAAFIWLAQRYDPLTAALVMGGAFLLITLIALVACSIAHRRTAERARLALAARSQTPWLDPRYLGVGLQIGRAIGWRKLVPLMAVGLLAAGLAREWFGEEEPAGDEGAPAETDAEDEENEGKARRDAA